MKIETFTLTINLGNEAMQDSEDVAFALREVADKLMAADFSEGTRVFSPYNIRDANGTTVGEWAVA